MLLCPWDFPGKSGLPFSFLGIFLIRGSNSRLLHWQVPSGVPFFYVVSCNFHFYLSVSWWSYYSLTFWTCFSFILWTQFDVKVFAKCNLWTSFRLLSAMCFSIFFPLTYGLYFLCDFYIIYWTLWMIGTLFCYLHLKNAGWCSSEQAVSDYLELVRGA